ncbi:MAG: hypothetical protein RIS64_2201 [Bacteroidota bacterium]|jgi:hypothetical protein
MMLLAMIFKKIAFIIVQHLKIKPKNTEVSVDLVVCHLNNVG